MRAKVLMVQGTGSDVGKSLIVAALCRIARRRGVALSPWPSSLAAFSLRPLFRSRCRAARA